MSQTRISPLFANFVGDSQKQSTGNHANFWTTLGPGGGFKLFFIFTPKVGEDEPILTFAYFSEGVVETTNQL